MRLRTTLVCVLAALGASVAHAQAPTTTTTLTKTTPGTTAPAVIGSGISAGGVDLSGLTVTQATARLQSAVAPALTRPLVLDVAGHSFHLTMTQADLRLDARATAKAALAAPSTAVAPGGGGGTASGTIVSLVLTHSHAAVTGFVNRVAGRVTVAPRDATLTIGVRHMTVRRARIGHTLDPRAAARLVDAALSEADTARTLHVAVVRLHPRVNANDVRNANPTIVTVDRANFVLRLFKHLKMVRRYPIAVGMAGLETPTGLYHVQDKQINPSWHVPDSPWAGSLAGQVIPPGPADPIVARWMGLAAGVGIHGTNEPWTVGSAASHGCIRMRVPDVIALFDRVPVGTPVLIH